MAHADRDLDDEGHFELPLPEDDPVALPLDGDDAGRRTAEAIVMAWVGHGINALQRPTNVARDATGRAVAFFPSGAFARLREQRALGDLPADLVNA